MRCNICDKKLTEQEIAWNKELKAFEPCSFCLEAAMDAAYSDGFQNPDDDNTLIIGEQSDEDRVDFVTYSDYKPLEGVRLQGDD